MSTSKLPYEAPAIRHNGDVVASTTNFLTKHVESDLTPRDAFGTVGFGV